MKRSASAYLTVILLCIFSSNLLAQETPTSGSGADYIIGPGDILDISVWKEQALTKLVTVLPDGKISFPLVGTISAGGKTLDQLTEELEKKLARFVPDLSLSVIVHQVNSMMVYVIGKVNAPGVYMLEKNTTVLQAIAMVRGFDEWANKDEIVILRIVP